MKFNVKLQELRKKKGLTQEELSKALFVSRTAVSKWESGRGYPNLESLKQIAELFSITIDELLSGNELFDLAQKDKKQSQNHLQDVVFGLLDCSTALLLFLPFFACKTQQIISEVSLLELTQISSWIKITYFVFVVAIIAFGILTLVLQNCRLSFWIKVKSKISVALSFVLSLLFIISLQPYAAVYLFAFLIIKVLMLIKW